VLGQGAVAEEILERPLRARSAVCTPADKLCRSRCWPLCVCACRRSPCRLLPLVAAHQPPPALSLPSRYLLPPQGNGADRRRGQQQRRVSELLCVRLDTPLTQALGLLLEAGVSCLPVVDSSGVLLDVYARADITMLAKVGWGGGRCTGLRCGWRAGWRLTDGDGWLVFLKRERASSPSVWL
jgi:hypothetical protein